MKIVEPSVKLLWVTPEAEKMIEIAGRTCYKSEPKSFVDCPKCHGTKRVPSYKDLYNDKFDTQEHDCVDCSKRSTREFIKKIIKLGHESVLEHSVVSLRVVCDRGVSHEFVRSRIGISYSQESTRYCNYSSEKFGNEITVIKPSNIKTYASWEIAMMKAEEAYLRMLENGDSAQVARSVLPTCLKTEIAVTANIRAWRHFLKQRLSLKAHPDMQIVAKLIYQELIKHCPNCFFDIVPTN